jgi:hypothetical protein
MIVPKRSPSPTSVSRLSTNFLTVAAAPLPYFLTFDSINQPLKFLYSKVLEVAKKLPDDIMVENFYRTMSVLWGA